MTPGALLVAGGTSDTTTSLSSSEAYGFATVNTDQSDYRPGSAVTISGRGFKPGETVAIQLLESPLIDTHGPYAIAADANGNIADSSFVTDIHDLNVRFYLTATGLTSGSIAQNTFTDSTNDSTSVTLTCDSAKVPLFNTLNCVATVKDTAATPNNGTPQGTIAFTESPTSIGTIGSPCTMNGGGCTVTFNAQTIESGTIRATYTSSSSNWASGSSATLGVTVTADGSGGMSVSPGSTSAGTSGNSYTFSFTL